MGRLEGGGEGRLNWQKRLPDGSPDWGGWNCSPAHLEGHQFGERARWRISLPTLLQLLCGPFLSRLDFYSVNVVIGAFRLCLCCNFLTSQAGSSYSCLVGGFPPPFPISFFNIDFTKAGLYWLSSILDDSVESHLRVTTSLGRGWGFFWSQNVLEMLKCWRGSGERLLSWQRIRYVGSLPFEKKVVAFSARFVFPLHALGFIEKAVCLPCDRSAGLDVREVSFRQDAENDETCLFP